ncbi:MAG: hypothetical protein ACYC7D_15820 [Nitrososphaerales archaeon]
MEYVSQVNVEGIGPVDAELDEVLVTDMELIDDTDVDEVKDDDEVVVDELLSRFAANAATPITIMITATTAIATARLIAFLIFVRAERCIRGKPKLLTNILLVICAVLHDSSI